MNDLQWSRAGHDHGAALARDLGLTPLYLLYNSGLHVSINGHALAQLLERLFETWPQPVQRLVLLVCSTKIGSGVIVSRAAAADGARRLAFAEHRQWVGYGMNHLDLLSRPEVLVQLKQGLG